METKPKNNGKKNETKKNVFLFIFRFFLSRIHLFLQKLFGSEIQNSQLVKLQVSD